MTLRYLPLFIAAVVLVGCKPADKAADSSTTPPAATADSTPATAPDTSAAPAATTADESKGSIVGTWLTEAKDAGPTFEFKDDKSFTITGTAGVKGATIAAGGTYDIAGDKMTVKFTEMKMVAASDADPNTKKMVDGANKDEAKALEAANKDPEQTFKMVNKDTFTTTGKTGKVTTFTRKAA
jgi:hypothetical protein